MAPKRSKRSRPEAEEEVYTLTYFGIFGKGTSIALALAHSGLQWKVEFPDDWPSLKPMATWGHLPLLEVPGGAKVGHELAILNYIGHISPAMGGESSVDFAASQQLMAQAEDIYQKLTKLQNTIMAKDKAPAEDVKHMWESTEAGGHNAGYGIPVYLQFIETFLTKCGDTKKGKFTSSGLTVGECKLFATFCILTSIKEDILAAFPGLTAFYKRVSGLKETKGVLDGTLNMPGPFKPYFIA